MSQQKPIAGRQGQGPPPDGWYEDIIYLPHPVSRSHRPMSANNRAAQFIPFSALSGHEAAIKAVARENGADV